MAEIPQTAPQVTSIQQLWIRQLLFGPPKTGKTKNSVETFPRPLVDINWDSNGYSSVDPKLYTLMEPEEFKKRLDANGPFPDITVVDFNKSIVSAARIDQFKDYTSANYASFLTTLNKLARSKAFKTVVVDSITTLSDFIMEFVGGVS